MSLGLRIDHCVIAVSDRDRSNAFLGSGRHVYFRDPDGSLLELVSYDAT